MRAKITGVGSHIPDVVRKNEEFMNHEFLNNDGSSFGSDNSTIIKKFVAITGIEERRYMSDELVTSDIATLAAIKAIEDANCDPETLDFIIVAHNYGDIQSDGGSSDMVPSLASRVKNKLGIKNPTCIAYDVLFGCPGWILGVTQADSFIKSGLAKKVLVIGAEALSRVVDPHDRDSMIYSDGAGAAVLEASNDEHGIIGQATATYTEEEAFFIFNETSYNKELQDKTKYIKMYGRRIYNFALSKVPEGMKSAMEQAGVDIKDLKKIFIHQANEKMDEAIVDRFYKLYDMEVPKDIMPMIIHKYGNSSVATVPTVMDLVIHDKMPQHKVEKGDVVMFASVGAGMNINAIVYRY
ncbi:MULTISPECIES: 3-oxoacyl-ACP synthase III family protein [Nonlabens]|uniref:3-oxoacyl-[acyl-carrier-protein] synthase-3 n=1 Tax=Nonlabens xylanidelens TaxID=191564 RepID=A0A2S6IKV8_9FLAO|nr:ketoacyl-ACP synthase III [Nonlabens xylanidelens]PPK94849.1 3-oxoacyl-[acyl-carrier-protein] synthase-3 [Nonlabens xylanidelens]PQJ17400.1 3-oxoacyl-ACP synthase [Nonlabens xylanidelens]